MNNFDNLIKRINKAIENKSGMLAAATFTSVDSLEAAEGLNGLVIVRHQSAVSPEDYFASQASPVKA